MARGGGKLYSVWAGLVKFWIWTRRGAATRTYASPRIVHIENGFENGCSEKILDRRMCLRAPASFFILIFGWVNSSPFWTTLS